MWKFYKPAQRFPTTAEKIPPNFGRGMENYNLFRSNNDPRNVTLDMFTAIWTISLKFFIIEPPGHLEWNIYNTAVNVWSRSAVFFSLNVQHSSKKKILLKNASKCFPGHVECDFQNPVENPLSKSWHIFSQCPEVIVKINFFKECVLSKCFSGTRRCSFDNPAENISLKRLLGFARCPENMKKSFFSPNQIPWKSSRAHLEFNFVKLTGKISP